MGLKVGKKIWKKWPERASGHRRWGRAGGEAQTLRWRKDGRSLESLGNRTQASRLPALRLQVTVQIDAVTY